MKNDEISVQADSIIPRATGCTIKAKDLLKREHRFTVNDFGVKSGGDSVTNTSGINTAIEKAASEGGGTVVFPLGEYKTYTIRLKSNVNLYLEEGTVIRAAKTDIHNTARDDIDFHMSQNGEGGNYDEPEVNLYAGIQDHGHSYFANSLLYGADLENIMIYGKGRFDGSDFQESTGVREYVLQNGDPLEPVNRNERGHRDEWFGNKCLALVRCKNIVLGGFDIAIGGHFAIIAEGVSNLLVEDMTVDTSRDAFNIDCCQNVTVRRSTFNSLTDDGIVMKASYGAGLNMPTRNVLIEDCRVSGYDAGSVLAGKYTTDKLVADDRCGPCGRVKFGTESTFGYDLVTICRVKFERSRGFSMEAVDGSNLSNVVFSDCEMTNVSSSPIFIRIGDRARYPVTGNSTDQKITAGENNVRLDDRRWILPNTEEYQSYPARRYAPAYNRSKEVSVDGMSSFFIIDPQSPVRLNPANCVCVGEKYYPVVYDEDKKAYIADKRRQISEKELPRYANAIGVPHLAGCYNIEISNLKVTNADPRYPIILAGLVDSRIKNVVFKDIYVEYRGGLKMEHAVEQRQLNTNWQYTQYQTASSQQSLPWLVNSFFSKEEGLLPRVSWDDEKKCWQNAPYNVPEQVRAYPEPSIFGILPAYGLYARHVDGLKVENLRLSFKVKDERPAVVLDDVKNAVFGHFSADLAKGASAFVTVTNRYKRHTNFEYLSDEPYFTTAVEELCLPSGFEAKEVEVNAPAPGTPPDSMYHSPTLPTPENGYHYRVPTQDYPLPLTIFRPFFRPMENKTALVGNLLEFTLDARNPAQETSELSADTLRYHAEDLPAGAVFDPESKSFHWVPEKRQSGTYIVRFVLSDGVLSENTTVTITVQR